MSRCQGGVLIAIRTFVCAETAAVSVDWVLLTAAMLAMVLGVFAVINETVFVNASSNIAADIYLSLTR